MLARVALLILAVLAAAAGPPLPAPTTDPLGDPLPKAARMRLGNGRLRHGYGVFCFAFSADGKVLVSSGGDHAIRLWDAKTSKLVRSLGEDLTRKNIYSGSRWVRYVFIAVDGKAVVAAGQDNNVTSWDATTGRPLAQWQVADPILQMAASPDGRFAATAGQNGKVYLWDARAGNLHATLSGRMKQASRLAFSPDSLVLATGGTDGTIRLWDVPAGKRLREIPWAFGDLTGLMFLDAGKRLAAAGSCGNVQVFDPNTGTRLHRHEGKAGEAEWLCATAGGRTIVYGGKESGTIQIRDGDLKLVRSVAGPGELSLPALAPDGETLAFLVPAHDANTIRLWDLTTGKERPTPPGHEGQLQLLAFAGGHDTLVAVGSEGLLRTWDAADGRLLHTTPVGDVNARPVALDGRLAVTRWGPSGQSGNGLVLRDAGAIVRRIEMPKYALGLGTLDAAAKVLATRGGDGTVHLWDTGTGKERLALTVTNASVEGLALSADGTLVATSTAEGVVALWDAATGKELRRMDEAMRGLVRLAFSADGRLLAGSGSDRFVHVWETASGKKVRRFTGQVGYGMALAFAPDGRTLASGNWGGTRVWDLASGTQRDELLGHRGDVTGLAFSRDGRRLASGGSDSVVVVWDTKAIAPAKPRKAPLLAGFQMEARWADLGNASGEKAYQAMWDLTLTPPQTVGLLRKHLTTAKAVEAKVLSKLIGDLDADDFDARQKASAELEKLGELAGPALLKALADAKDVDLKLRLGVLVGKLRGDGHNPDHLRILRAVQALELLDTPEAGKLLRELAAGAPGATQTREAAAALARRP